MWKHDGKKMKVMSKGCVDPDRIPLQCDYLNGKKPYWRNGGKNTERISIAARKRNKNFGIQSMYFNIYKPSFKCWYHLMYIH